MRNYFILSLMALSLAFISCNKTADIPGVSSSITSNGVISGTVVNNVANIIDSISVVGNGLIGKSLLSSTGQFSFTINIPSNFSLYPIGNEGSGVTVSDSTALTAAFQGIYSYKKGIMSGVLLKINSTTDSLNKAGISVSYFVYSDRVVKMLGTHISTETINGITYKTTSIYNLTLNKGWNEFTCTVNSYSKIANSYTESDSYSNTIGSDLQWRYFGYPSSKVRSNAKSQQRALSFLR